MASITLACVEWADAHGSTGTIAEHEIEHRPYVFTAVGYLVKSDEVGVSLAFERGEDGMYRDVSFIPRAMVIKEWVIGPLKEPRRRKQSIEPLEVKSVPDAHPNPKEVL